MIYKTGLKEIQFLLQGKQNTIYDEMQLSKKKKNTIIGPTVKHDKET